jgi:integral membrane protein
MRYVTQPSKENPSVSEPVSPSRPVAAGGIKDVEAARKALRFFVVMAFVVGTGLLILVAEMILKYGFSKDWLDWWPQPHGFIYIVYLAATANLGFKVGWSLGRMVLVMLAGVVPFLSFWAERKVAAETEARLAAVRR